MGNEIYEKLQNIAKKYTVLYVEDDDLIKEAMSRILQLFSGKLYTASDGKEGLKLFYAHKPDLIITDISMPIMNGIEMIKEIRQNNKEIPIMINSAFSDKDYLLDSIYIGVDRYTVKPIKHEEFLGNLLFLFTKLQQRDQAETYEKICLQERINKASTDMLKTTIEVYPNPTLIYAQDGSLHLLNTAAALIFDISSLTEENKKNSLSGLFLEREGYICDLSLVKENSLENNKVMIRTKIAKKIYIVSKRSIETEEFGRLFLYAFTDITRIEYEKQKSKNLSMFLREGVCFKECKQRVHVPKFSLHVKAEVAPKPIESYDKIRLSSMHYVEKTSAVKYASEVGEDILEELSEMDELEQEMYAEVHDLEDEFTLKILHDLAYGFSKYGKTIARLVDFEDVAFSLDKLSTLLLGISEISFEKRKMHLLLNGIVEDLKHWRKMLFITKEALDIHYLDASLLSSCLQIEMEFGNGEHHSDDDLDLF